MGSSFRAGGSSANGTVILGNLIGTTSSGLAPLANGGAGIDVDGASNTQIGMPGGGYGNVVSGNLGRGNRGFGRYRRHRDRQQSDRCCRERHGADRQRRRRHPDRRRVRDMTIGGTDPDDGNVIGGNLRKRDRDARRTPAPVLVEGNDIGTDATGTIRLGNRQNGVQLASSSNTIGGIGGECVQHDRL